MATDPEKLVDQSVRDLRDALDDYDGDLQTVLAAEKSGKDRKTAKEAIRDAMADRRTAGADMAAVKEAVRGEVEADESAAPPEAPADRFIKTGVPGFDDLFEHGIPRGSPVLVSGGAGSGKTIFCLQTLAQHAAQGEKCFYMSFEEPEDALKQHMRDFGWNPDELIASGNLKIKRFSPFEVTRQMEAMLAKEKGELLIDVDPVLLPEFEPDYVVIDSLTAIASAFSGEEESYRIYIEQLFRFFEERNATSFMVSETREDPEQFSPTGVEEFLADGVIVLYNIKRGNVRESAVEVLKMRGTKHEKKMVAMQIGDDGITVYPDQEVF